jgi:hypothetical protein
MCISNTEVVHCQFIVVEGLSLVFLNDSTRNWESMKNPLNLIRVFFIDSVMHNS